MIYAVLVLLFGAGCGWAALSSYRLRARVLAWPTVRGRIVEKKAIQPTDRGRTSSPAFRWSPEARFTYRVGDKDYTGDKIMLPWTWTNTKEKAEAYLATIPDDVDVRYDPAEPATSCLYPLDASNAFWYGVPAVCLLLVGAIMLFAALT